MKIEDAVKINIAIKIWNINIEQLIKQHSIRLKNESNSILRSNYGN